MVQSMSRDISVTEIRPNPRQPRRHFDGIEELAESLKAKGQLTPVLVRPMGEDFELVHGERRWRAAKLAGLPTLRAEVRELSDAEAFGLSLIENIQRAELTPIEEAEAYKVLLTEGMTQGEVGALIGKTQSYVAQKLRLLRAPDPVRVLLAAGALTEGHARQLLRLEKLYPPGRIFDLSLLAEADYASPEILLQLHIEMRPEESPPRGLWKRGSIEESDQKQAVIDSWASIVGQAAQEVPLWITAAWWWGVLAVVGGISVAVLSKAIDCWHERFVSAILYLSLHEKQPKSDSEAAWWWGAYGDAKHSGCYPVTEKDWGHVCLSPAFRRSFAQGWVEPSGLQFRNREPEAGTDSMSRDMATELARIEARMDGAIDGACEVFGKGDLPQKDKYHFFFEELDAYWAAVKTEAAELGQRLDKVEGVPASEEVLGEVVDVRNRAAELQNQCAELGLYLERRAGRVLNELEAVR